MDIIKYAKKTFEDQILELDKVKGKIDSNFEGVIKLILETKGKLVITGIGKTGIIGQKIAATLASTGTTTIFMHSTEGLHGDLGMVNDDDLIIAISNSGNSDEIKSIIPSIKKRKCKIVAMTGNFNSELAKNSDLIIDIGVEKETCPMNLAPTCSTTAALVMGDAIATTLIKLKKFKSENYALFHPGGSLGRRLLTKVENVMHCEKDIPICFKNSNINDVILEMTQKGLGIICVISENKLSGIITEGDIRRALKAQDKFFSFKASDIMTENFTSINKNIMAIEALEIMENRKSQISVLPVLENKSLIGVVRIHDLLSVKN